MVSDGTGQRDREVPTFELVDVDERSIETMLTQAVRHSQLLQFHDRNNQPSGDWSSLFTRDETVILAMIMTTDLQAIQAEFRRTLPDELARLGPDYDGNRLATWELARRLDQWLGGLRASRSEVGEALEQRIRQSVVSHLRADLRGLRNLLSQYGVDNSNSPSLSAIWYQDDHGEDPPPLGLPPELTEDFLWNNFESFYNTVSALQATAGALLRDSLTTGTHDPAVAMYLTFLQLFRHAQARLNRFTADHQQFYYQQVLQIRPQPALPEHAMLVLATDLPETRVSIPVGTAFRAELEPGAPYMVFEADHALTLTGTQVAALRTFHFDHDPDSFPERESSLRFSTSAHTTEIPVVPPSVLATGAELQAWPLFGASRPDVTSASRDDARVGFAFASNALFLNEGDRRVILTLRLTMPDSFRTLARVLMRTGQESKDSVFYKIFGEMFLLHLTTANGWHEVKEYLAASANWDVDGHNDIELELSFTLAASVEPVVTYAAALHGNDGDYATTLPVLRLLINPRAYSYPYSMLRDVQVRGGVIDVAVRNLRNVTIANNLEPIAPGAPFTPFGPVPRLGAYLVIGSAEAARKRLTRVDVTVEWGDLPIGVAQDFEQYYAGYRLPFATSLFTARIAALGGGHWLPAAEELQPEVQLFADTGDARWPQIRYQRWSIGDQITRYLTPELREADAYSALSRSGYFRISLSGPAYAFGHREYPQVLTRVLTANGRLKRPELAQALPNAPYTPLINSIAIDYWATARIDLDHSGQASADATAERFFHVHPFGVQIAEPNDAGLLSLVPQYHADGNLCIGLASPGAPSGELTLAFYLRNDSAPALTHATQPAHITWQYLRGNAWHVLGRSAVLSDTTRGFLTSGMVTLMLPDDLDRDHTIMPGEYYWLRVSVDDHPEALCSLYAVHAQALSVTARQTGGAATDGTRRIPAGTIKEPLTSIPGVAAVYQISESSGGRPPESAEAISRRVSERLRHKDRAVTPWDYERLIFQHFPSVLKVKCFPSMIARAGYETLDAPGHVSIVVLTDAGGHHADAGAGTMQHLKPMASQLLLREIRDYVVQLNSAFAEVTVRNASYEEIQIRCAVRFTPGIGEGQAIEQLNRALTDYLSPWTDAGGFGGQFGWILRRYDLETYIRNLDYIDFVTGVAMLRVAAGEATNTHVLFDSGTGLQVADQLQYTYPWGIAVPMQSHVIQVIRDATPLAAEPVGVSSLAIGTTFVIPDSDAPEDDHA